MPVPMAIPQVPPANVQTLTEVAKAFGKSKAAVTGWKKEGCPHLQGGPPYSLRSTRDWLVDREEAKQDSPRGANRKVKSAVPEAAAPAVALNEEEAEKVRSAVVDAETSKAKKLYHDAQRSEFDAQIKQLQVELTRDSYFKRSVVEEMLAARARMLQVSCDTLPANVAPKIVELCDGAVESWQVIEALEKAMDAMRAIWTSDDPMTLLDQRAARDEHGVSAGRGRGRIKSK